MDKKKVLKISIIVVLLLVIVLMFFKFYNYNNLKNGNNIGDKTLMEIEEYILNISSYTTDMEVVIESNKNVNKYIMHQEFVAPNIVSQKIIEPKNIEGLTVKYDGNNLEIFNSNLNLNTIYENYVRKYLIGKGIGNVNDLQNNATNYVSAVNQAKFLTEMMNSNFLTEEELDVVKRARNYKTTSHPKSCDIITYKYATGLEALIGYLDLKNKKERIDEIMNFILER